MDTYRVVVNYRVIVNLLCVGVVIIERGSKNRENARAYIGARDVQGKQIEA